MDNVIRVYLANANTAIRQEILCIGKMFDSYTNNHNQILFEVEGFCQKGALSSNYISTNAGDGEARKTLWESQ